MEYLTFEKLGTGNAYSVTNTSGDIIAFIERIRNGQWMHYSLTIPMKLMEECIEQGCGLTFSPGCQDEIREFCKRLNAKAMEKKE